MSDDMLPDAPQGGLFPILDRIANILLFISIAMILLMTIHIVGDTIIRSVTDLALEGTLEISSYYYMVALIFLPLAYIQRRRGHLVAEIFTQGLRSSTQRLLDAIADLLMAAFLGVLVYQTGEIAWTATVDQEFVDLSDGSIDIWPTKWLVPIGFGMMGLFALCQAVALLAGGGKSDGGGRGGGRGGETGGGSEPPSAGSSLT